MLHAKQTIMPVFTSLNKYIAPINKSSFVSSQLHFVAVTERLIIQQSREVKSTALTG